MTVSSQISADWRTLAIEHDEEFITLDALREADGARALPLDDVTSILTDPDNPNARLRVQDGNLTLPSGEMVQMRGHRPVLLPAFARTAIRGDTFHFESEARAAPGLQYLYLSDAKAHGGDQNSSYSDIWYQRHLFRTRRLTAGATGSLLDIGCDTPSVSRRMFPDTVDYVGLEPSLGSSDQFCICGMAEFIPFSDASFDNVALLTSLDHILDAHRAVEEASRVLRPGGTLFLASLVWHRNASLIRDTVHFHHFRDWELQGLLRALKIDVAQRYSWKGDQHRYGVYISARKP